MKKKMKKSQTKFLTYCRRKENLPIKIESLSHMQKHDMKYTHDVVTRITQGPLLLM